MFRPFGGSSGAFGAGSIPPSPQQPSASGSSSFFGGGSTTLPPFSSPHVPFQPQKDNENGVSFTINSISAMPNYIGKSFEEIRFEDYALGRKGRTSAFPSSQQQNMTSSFINQNTSNPFGTQQPSSATPFGGMGGSGGMGFGQQQQPLGGGLGGGSTGSMFGQQQPTSSLFAPQQPAAATGTSFGNTNPFGSSIGQQTTSTPSASTGFGQFGFGNTGSGLGGGGSSIFNNPAPSSASSGSLFQPQAQNQQAQSNTPFAPSFSAPNMSAPSTNFGTNLFQPSQPQQQQPQQQATSSGFGFPQPSTTTQQTSLFPSFKPPTSSTGLFNTPSTTAPTGSSLFPNIGNTGASTTAPSAGGFDLFKSSQPSTTQTSNPLGGASSLFPTKPSLFTPSASSAGTGSLFNTSAPSLIGSQQQQPTSSLFKPATLGVSTTSLPVIAPPPEILSIAPPLHPSLKSILSSVKPAEPKPLPAYNPLPSTQTSVSVSTQSNSGEIVNIVPKIIGNLVPLNSNKKTSKNDYKKLVITVSMQSEDVDEESSSSAPARIGDYYMEPSEVALSKLSPSQLASVSDFVIGQTGVGEIRFLKPVDLTSVDLDRIFSHIVRFEPKQVVMYPEEDKPAIGTGLNQPALIKLERCWPTQRGSRALITDPDNERMRQHIERLKNVLDTKFVSFDPATGVKYQLQNTTGHEESPSLLLEALFPEINETRFANWLSSRLVRKSELEYHLLQKDFENAIRHCRDSNLAAVISSLSVCSASQSHHELLQKQLRNWQQAGISYSPAWEIIAADDSRFDELKAFAIRLHYKHANLPSFRQRLSSSLKGCQDGIFWQGIIKYALGEYVGTLNDLLALLDSPKTCYEVATKLNVDGQVLQLLAAQIQESSQENSVQALLKKQRFFEAGELLSASFLSFPPNELFSLVEQMDQSVIASFPKLHLLQLYKQKPSGHQYLMETIMNSDFAYLPQERESREQMAEYLARNYGILVLNDLSPDSRLYHLHQRKVI